MGRPASITLREIEPADLDVFYEHQLDPEAIRLAAFVSATPRDRAAFGIHWDKNLCAPRNTNRTILVDGRVAGHVACFPCEEKLAVTYWLGREFWGRGVATEALTQLLQLVATRPVFARAATDNLGSLRALQKCGFKVIGQDKGFAHGRGADTEEYILRLDPDPARG